MGFAPPACSTPTRFRACHSSGAKPLQSRDRLNSLRAAQLSITDAKPNRQYLALQLALRASCTCPTHPRRQRGLSHASRTAPTLSVFQIFTIPLHLANPVVTDAKPKRQRPASQRTLRASCTCPTHAPCQRGLSHSSRTAPTPLLPGNRVAASCCQLLL